MTLAYFHRMTDKAQAEKDLKRAQELVRNFGSFVTGGYRSIHKNIARIVARALAEGREEGIKIGEQRAKGKSDD